MRKARPGPNADNAEERESYVGVPLRIIISDSTSTSTITIASFALTPTVDMGKQILNVQVEIFVPGYNDIMTIFQWSEFRRYRFPSLTTHDYAILNGGSTTSCRCVRWRDGGSDYSKRSALAPPPSRIPCTM